eukprot:SM000194S04805  [mRNA]  locus=s194:39034:39544:+ [translate_table: standard]
MSAAAAVGGDDGQALAAAPEATIVAAAETTPSLDRLRAATATVVLTDALTAALRCKATPMNSTWSCSIKELLCTF